MIIAILQYAPADCNRNEALIFNAFSEYSAVPVCSFSESYPDFTEKRCLHEKNIIRVLTAVLLCVLPAVHADLSLAAQTFSFVSADCDVTICRNPRNTYGANRDVSENDKLFWCGESVEYNGYTWYAVLYDGGCAYICVRGQGTVCVGTSPVSHREFLLQLLRDEIDRRQQARQLKFLNTAGFPRRYSVDQYRTDEIDFPSGVSFQSLLDLDFLKKETM